MTAASWIILILCALLGLSVVVAALWLRSRGAEIERLQRLNDAFERQSESDAKKAEIHATPDLGPFIRGPDRRGPVPGNR